MKQFLFSLLGLVLCLGLNAQSDTTKPQSADTIKVGNMIIIKKHDGKEKKTEKDDEDDDEGTSVEIKKRKEYKKSNVSTNWLILDLGFSNVNDQTNYASPEAQAFFPGGTKEQMGLRNGRSINVNVWFFIQRVNLIKHVVNLKYGLGVEMNNYSFEKSIRYNTEPVTNITIDNFKYRKNKLAADYLTVPVMLDFNFAPKRKKGYGFSAGVSAGYMYAARQKMKSEQNGKEKVRSDFNLEPWKLSAIGELNLGAVGLYGSYALNNLHKNGLEQTPYNFGIRFSSW
ncbi:outer membrane beta-barrel protein [Lacibacter sediminis]|uniref:Outer membrane beta-barrel protein n=1 Tax=Lacibacter sediminis TaxID=2760713 RepID=A0A7G5XEJ6_9BACT|nr:outer membrane beta-barrel protein [Lacibacter sediminis]QNA43899.1 outer membrane beta-barrel protein [Lacibacter sediminis]